MIRIVFIAFFAVAVVRARSQDTSLSFKDEVSLKISEGPALMRQCSRLVPQHITGFWEVSPDTIAIVERNLWRLPGPFEGTKRHKPVTHADSLIYFRHLGGNQFIGVIIGGQRYVYINHLGHLYDACMTRACIICDGGSAFWGALFNVTTLEFSEEAYNGDA